MQKHQDISGKWVIDGSNGWPPKFRPVHETDDGSLTVLQGIAYEPPPPGTVKLIAVVHDGGKEACDAFCAEYRAELDKLMAP